MSIAVFACWPSRKAFAEDAVAFGMNLLANASAEWSNATGEEKMRLQAGRGAGDEFSVPDGIRCEWDAFDLPFRLTIPAA